MILAIDTTALVASVALVGEDSVLAEMSTNFKQTHSETIMPMVDHIFKTVKLDKNDVEFIACSSGPGSFTGLRIGVSTAKGLAYGMKKPIIPVPTLDAMANNLLFCDKDILIVPIMDARRNQVYTALYKSNNEGFAERLTDYMGEDINDIFEMIRTFGEKAVFIGDGIPVHKEKIDAHKNFFVAPQNVNRQRAASVGTLAWKSEYKQNAVAASGFAPYYIRKSQAEREYDDKNKVNENI